MVMTVECPECFHVYRFKESAGGRRFKCRECGRPFRIEESSLDDYAELPELKQNSSSATASANPGLPPRAGRRHSRGRSRPSERPARIQSPDSGQMSMIMGILCLVHSGGTVAFGWRSLRTLLGTFQNAASPPSVMFLISLAAAVAFVVAGIGLLMHADWANQLACITAAVMLVLLGIGIVISVFRLLGSEAATQMGIDWIGYLLTGTLKSAAIPGIVLWWTLQEQAS